MSTLSRGMINYSLGREIMSLVQERCDGDRLALGVGMATLILCVVNMATQEKDDLNTVRIMDALSFAADLFKNGYEVPDSVLGTQ